MKVIVFGSTGSVGQHLVTQALESGHQVSAFTRNRNNVKVNHDRLQIIEGDVMELQSVNKAITGHEIVFCALGSGRKGEVRSKGTLNIIKAMENNGIKRLICQTTLGAGDSAPNLNFFWKNIMFGWFLKEAYLDHQTQEKYVMESNLDWTIIRPGAFTNGDLSGIYKHGFSPDYKDISLKISRADVAHFMLNQAKDLIYLHKTPALSY